MVEVCLTLLIKHTYNKIKHMRYLFFILLSANFLYQAVVNHHYFHILWVVVLIATLLTIRSVEQNPKKGGLSLGEKLSVIITSLMLNFISTAFYYFTLKNINTQKTKQTIKYSLYSSLIFIIPIILIVASSDVINFFK